MSEVPATPIRPTVAHIDLGAIRNNLKLVRELAPGRAVCAMVKANAYGHGLVPVAQTLAAAGVDWLAVALVEEGLTLREAGVHTPILVAGGALEGGYGLLVEHQLTPALFRPDHLQALAAAAAAAGRAVDFHLKIDTGMARLGIRIEELPRFLLELEKLPSLRLDGVFTHFANADLADRSFNEHQLALLKKGQQILSDAGYKPRWVHIANSAAVMAFSAAHDMLVRPGLMLYGLDPMRERTQLALQPAMRWVTRPIHIKTVTKGSRVSYGGRWTAPQDSLIATLPVGYADGYPRCLTNKAQVLIRGQRAGIVGAVCMDLCMVDVSHLGPVTLLDEVVLLGRQGPDEITAYELAEWADTIAYEIICGISARVPRQHRNSAA